MKDKAPAFVTRGSLQVFLWEFGEFECRKTEEHDSVQAGVWDAWSSKTNRCKDSPPAGASSGTMAKGTEVSRHFKALSTEDWRLSCHLPITKIPKHVLMTVFWDISLIVWGFGREIILLLWSLTPIREFAYSKVSSSVVTDAVDAPVSKEMEPVLLCWDCWQIQLPTDVSLEDESKETLT